MLLPTGTSLRTMAAVDTTSRPMLNFLCSACMEPMRGDKLVLAAHHPTRQMTTQQQQTQRRLMDNFADIASSECGKGLCCGMCPFDRHAHPR